MWFAGSKNETRCFQLKPSANLDFERGICTKVVNSFGWSEPGGADRDAITTVIERMNDIDNSDGNYSKKAIPLIERGTHYISAISLGACESIESSANVTSNRGAMNLQVGAANVSNIKLSRGTSTELFQSIKRGNVSSVQLNGKGEEKEYVIDQVASPVYELLRQELKKLKHVLHTSIEIYTKRKSKWKL